MLKRSTMSRFAAGGLLTFMAAVTIFHFTKPLAVHSALKNVVAPLAVHVHMIGEITRMTPHGMTVVLEDRHGKVTNQHRVIQFTDSTLFYMSGEAPHAGKSGEKLLKTGYRALISGVELSNHDVTAQSIHLTFPPVHGVIDQIGPSMLMVKIAHAPR
ncbi:MAG: hypothetical protein OWS74_00430, partial [Firmicutes bacterium]|nr:hypothetical protein [Bacillota bacterium]